jgi:hypothetical protein
MLDVIVSVLLAAAFLYVMLLMTNPRGSWNCPIARLLSWWIGPPKPPQVRRGQH